MPSAPPITFAESRTIFEIVGECLEQWSDPDAWQAHLLRRASQLTACRLGIYYEMADAPGKPASRIIAATDGGWSRESERRTLVAGLAEKELNFSPYWSGFARQLSRERGVTLRQRAVLPDRQWHASAMYDDYVRPTEIGQGILSAIWKPESDFWSVWCLANDRGDRPITERQETLMAALHAELAPLIATRLCTRRSRSLARFSPPRRAVLAALLEGRSEKEIAARLARSSAAVHVHIHFLYRHFGVTSRGELAAYFLQRRPSEDRGCPKFDPVKNWLARPRPPSAPQAEGIS